MQSRTQAPPRAKEVSPLSRKLYAAVWRWHFYAGLFVIPFLLILAVTGLMMMYITQFDGRDGEKIAIPVGEAPLPVSQQAEAALAAIPGDIIEWIGPKGEGLATVFHIASDGEKRMVAVNPYTGGVIETWDRRAGWYDLADNIHSTLMIGDTGDLLLEIAAGLGLVLVLTGLYIWWPRGRLRTALVPNIRARGRTFWKSLHAVFGFYVSLLLVVFLITGLTWTSIWGGRIIQAWNSFPAEKWDNVPLSDTLHASMNHGHQNDVPWTLEQTPMPASGSNSGTPALPEGEVDIDAMVGLAHAMGLEGRFRVAYPVGETGVWTLNRDSMSGDSTDPVNDRTIHVDRFTGKILADIKYADYSVMGKTMAQSTPFHMGILGPWNLILNTLFCLAVIFLCLSGMVMWVIRRPSRSRKIAAPPAPSDMPFWKGAILIGLLVSMAFPLLGVTLLLVLTFDVLILSRIPAMKRMFD